MPDAPMQDADAAREEEMMYGHDAMTEEELNEKYPNRPHNHSKTLPFHDLFLTLFNPLNDNKKKPTGPTAARRKHGPHGPKTLTPHEIRRDIIDRFISRWRKEVGNDIYPAFRLIVPDKDRDRAMYGLKEKTIGKLLVHVLRIDKDSEDGYNLLNWKLPGQKATTAMAGDFAGRCYEVISKRPMRTKVGDMSIAEVNAKLDQLSVVSKEEDQLPIFQEFYNRMNAEELMWLIRIILRQMKVGATEKTFFDLWHPDAESLFNVSSSLRRVCWELYDPNIRLNGDDRGISLMQCFQPQLAAFQMQSFEKMVARMKPTDEDDAFWIEEKLDGERMQLHMIEDDNVPGGFRFGFWSRKAKDYAYLYGNGFMDENSALTRHLTNAFNPGVRNIILDGEMITWDMEQDAMVPFGTLKTAALSEQRNPFSGGQRPVYRVFDCLYLNDQPLTQYTLRDRRQALEQSISQVNRRLEIHTYVEAHSVAEIEPLLRQVVAEASEGLVLKNPRSMYRLNERNDDWIKVKPEYMTEFGEALDCLIIGGYYGSGRRGGNLSSFLCGLRVDENQIRQGADPMCFYSFCRVGGGFTAGDYRTIRHQTDGKWHDWDPKKPPTEYISLAGGDKQIECPDVWIRPDDSLVVSIKAASVTQTDQFRMGLTLRFPRFKRLRMDKNWRTALSINEFIELKNNVETEQKEKAFQVDEGRRKRLKTSKKKPLTIAGAETVKTQYGGPETKVFEGLTFFIMTEATGIPKKSKAEIEQLIKANGGTLVQQAKDESVICVADRPTVSVSSLRKKGERNIVRPRWIFDCIQQNQADLDRSAYLLPFEPNHMFFLRDEDQADIEANVDEYGDSYARDVTIDELRKIFDNMPTPPPSSPSAGSRSAAARLLSMMDNEDDVIHLPGFIFHGLVIYFDNSNGDDLELQMTERYARFAGGTIASVLEDEVTHVVSTSARAKQVRKEVAERSKAGSRIPYMVGVRWIEECWKERTRVDEEAFSV